MLESYTTLDLEILNLIFISGTLRNPLFPFSSRHFLNSYSLFIFIKGYYNERERNQGLLSKANLVKSLSFDRPVGATTTIIELNPSLSISLIKT